MEALQVKQYVSGFQKKLLLLKMTKRQKMKVSIVMMFIHIVLLGWFSSVGPVPTWKTEYFVLLQSYMNQTYV